MPGVGRIAAIVAVAAVAALWTWLPDGGSASGETGTGGGREQGANGGSVPWSYIGMRGPAFWGSLSPAYAPCAAGRMQSPIDVGDGFPARARAPVFDYRPSPLTIVNNGHTVQVDYATGSTLTVAGEVYELFQFHFHTPAEHEVAGARASMEVHFVHRSASGVLAVVGVMIEVGRHNEALAVVFDNMPAEPGPAVAVAGETVDASAMLPPQSRAFSHYRGSLTTPPCSEGVRWFVLATAVEASEAQVAAFRRISGPNARPLQGLNNRLLIASP